MYAQMTCILCIRLRSQHGSWNGQVLMCPCCSLPATLLLLDHSQTANTHKDWLTHAQLINCRGLSS